jgi:phospholipid-binding lipoprotein MlaA
VSRRSLSLALGLALLGGGCATVPKDPYAKAAYEEANDPLEPLNREIFSLNLFLDRILIKPMAQGYVRVVPRPGRDSIKNFVSNLNEPVVFANNLLQGQFARAGTSVSRFVLDSTLGIGGLLDFAQLYGLRKETGDFGQTLFAWGVPDGPYLVLPIFGPSNPRDAAGLGVDAYLSPYRYVVQNNNFPTLVAYGPAIAGGIDERSRSIDELDAIQKEAVDYYASLRSLFRQNRAAQLKGKDLSLTSGQESLYEDPGVAPPAKGPPGASQLNR